MPQTRPNGVITPVPSDDYNPPQDMADMADSIMSIVKVADQSAMNTLDTLYPGGVLPNPTYASRTDQGGELWLWNGVSWRTLNDTGIVLQSDVNWGYNGGLIRARGGARSHVQLSLRLSRVGSGFSVTNSAYLVLGNFIPAGWRPTIGAFSTVNIFDSGSGFRYQAILAVSQTGDFLLQTLGANQTVNFGDFISIDMGWHAA